MTENYRGISILICLLLNYPQKRDPHLLIDSIYEDKDGRLHRCFCQDEALIPKDWKKIDTSQETFISILEKALQKQGKTVKINKDNEYYPTNLTKTNCKEYIEATCMQ